MWSGILALGLQFLWVGARVRFDQGYAYFGYSLLLLGGMLCGSAWGGLRPDASDLAWLPFPNLAWLPFSSLAWLSLAHLLALPFFATAARFFYLVTDGAAPRAEVWLRRWCAALAPLFLFDALTGKGWLVSGSMEAPRSTLAYAVLFTPCLAFFVGLTWRTLFLRFRAVQRAERMRLSLFAGGWAAFTAFALADEARLLRVLPGYGPDYGPDPWGRTGILIGAGLFAASGAYLLMQRFLFLHRSNSEALARLGEAYAGLRESAGLKAIGASAASISHEIRNYAATLKGNTQLLLRHPMPTDWSGEAERIRLTAERMEAISMDIAAYSRSPLASGKRPLRLDAEAGMCARLHFPERAGSIMLGPWPAGALVQGDAGRLSQVFFNLFKNAMEAGARRIDVRFLVFGNRLVMAVEDDGLGCPAEELGRIAVPFFSGKGDGGTGLGCSIAEAILAEHGATFRAYSKNALAGPGTGLVVNMVFPLAEPVSLGNFYGTVGAERGGPDARWMGGILVVSENNDMRAEMLAPLIHLGIHPTVCRRAVLEGLPAGAANPPVFIEDSLAKGIRADWGSRRAMSVNRFRLASVLGREDGVRTRILFSEENLAGMVLDRGRP